MSFDNPSSFTPWQSPLISPSEKQSRFRESRDLQSVWDQPPVSGSGRRGLALLATSNLDNTSSDNARRAQQLHSSEIHPPIVSSPSSGLPAIPSASSRFSGRRLTPGRSSPATISSSTHSQTGSQPQSNFHSGRSIAFPRTRAITPSSQNTPSSIGNIHTALGAGGGGGFSSNSRSGAHSPSTSGPVYNSPTNQTLERSASVSSNISPSSSQSSFSKISATQIVLLLDTISEKEGPVKWDTKAEKIRRLLDSNGKEVFVQFLRRAIVLNWSAIFGQLRDFDQGSYKLLQEQIEGARQDPTYASYIADAIDSAREDNFRDFDLGAFIRHFLWDQVSQCVLAAAFTTCARSDLRNKANALLIDNAGPALRTLSDLRVELIDLNQLNIAAVIGYYATAVALPHDQREEIHWNILHKLSTTYRTLGPEIMSASQLWRLPENDRALIDAFRRAGPRSTNSRTSIEDVLSSAGHDRISEAEIANAILFMLFQQSSQQYNLQEFVAVVKNYKQVDWNEVVRIFDTPNLRVNNDTFLRLFNALLQIAIDDSQFDIQGLWGGVWQNILTQVSFLKSFLLADAKDIRTDRIPSLRPSLVATDLDGHPSQAVQQIQAKFDGQYSSADATKAILEVVLSTDQVTEEADATAILQDLVQNHMDAFVLSLYRLPRPKGPTQENFVERCFLLYLEQRRPDYKLVLDALFKQSPEFTNFLCTLCFHSDPRRTEIIYERSEEFGWTETFLKAAATPLALDLACMRHKLRGDFDLDRYISDAVNGQSQTDRLQYGNTLWKYLRIKADDEYRVQREQVAPQSVPLSLKSVFTFLWKLQDLVNDREQLKAAQTTCLQTYPRLMNYGTGFDEILERRSEERGNKLPEEIDDQMSELFGRMYRSEVSIRDMVTQMREYKTSNNAEMQDLFCCIVHGLFDEYICYSEYPEDALEKTALLFGSIIRYKLLPPIPQEYGLTLIMDAVRDHAPDSNMHRFGIEALLQISERLPEWPSLCRLLLQIPGLQHTEVLQKAEEGIREEQAAGDGSNGADEAFAIANGSVDEMARDGAAHVFRSVHADAPSFNASFREPEQKVQEKILFVINNLSNDNMESKLADMQEVLTAEHYQWFAAYLVEQRARLEPNNQQMYFEFVSRLNDKSLMTEVVRETYASVVKMMNARSTVESATERSHLKSLGGWLGSLTLAQDKPIKHKNIYFIDLLLEGLDSQRLVVVIPFTCKVLVQGSRSMVFKPPNPWLMEIIGLLLELYHFAELKLNLKFEIEVLCKDLGLDHKKISPATTVRERPQQMEDEMTNVSGMPEGLGTFDDELTLNGPMSRGVRERISAQEIMSSLPSLEEVLRYPPLPGTSNEQALVKNIIYRAFDQAIQEIIAPVVERSITIASISTAQLVSKDYALEPDVERYKNAARQMVKSLAGSLALVTCKEPLRMSITNYIRRQAMEEVPEHLMSEGSILMCVNDNLDNACNFVEQAAEERSVPEIDHVIEQELEERRRFQAENPGRDYYSSNISRWSTWIPEPYKQTPGGLNEAQRAVYEDFDRRVHGMNASHVQNASTDSTGRQIPDVLQETLAMPNLSTPADLPAIPHQSPLTQVEPRTHSSMQQQPRMNGFSDGLAPHDRIALLIDEVQKAARTSSASRLKDVDKNSSIFQDVRQILIILSSSTRPAADHIARQIAEKICHTFIAKSPQNPLEAELLAFLLHKLCMLSELIVRDVMRWTTASEDVLLGNSYVTAALVAVGLMDLARIDGVISAALRDHNEHGLQLLAELMEQTLFTEEPIALRADFGNSIVALYAWLREQPDLRLASEISSKLKARGVPEYVTAALSDKTKAKHDQMQYIFREWVALYENMAYSESAYATFLRGLHNDQIINNSEDLAVFVRLSTESCIEGFDNEAQSFRGSLTAAFSRTDALAQLVIILLKFQGDNNGAVKKSKAKYLESVLSMVVLVLNYHHEIRGTNFNQRVFTRLLNSLLYEFASFRLDMDPDTNDMILAFARTVLALSPGVFPGFTYGWMSLICNRVLVDTLLRSGEKELVDIYRTLMGSSLQSLSSMTDSAKFEALSENCYRGVLRNFYVLKHDYPDFVSENHVFFCTRISYAYPQLRNLVLTARPHGFHDEPDPLTPGLKIERLEEMKKTPFIANDITEPLEREDVLPILTSLRRKSENIVQAVKQYLEVVAGAENFGEQSFARPSTELEIHEYTVAWLVAECASSHEKFNASSAEVQFLSKLVTMASDYARYVIITAIADHLRFPNSHTEFASKLFLHLWDTSNAHQELAVLRETMSRVIFERLIQMKPHPWGMIIVFQELSSNPMYGFWENATFGANAELRQRLIAAVRTHG